MTNPDPTPVYIPEQVEKDIRAVVDYVFGDQSGHDDFISECKERGVDPSEALVTGDFHIHSPAYRLMRFVEGFISK